MFLTLRQGILTYPKYSKKDTCVFVYINSHSCVALMGHVGRRPFSCAETADESVMEPTKKAGRVCFRTAFDFCFYFYYSGLTVSSCQLFFGLMWFRVWWLGEFCRGWGVDTFFDWRAADPVGGWTWFRCGRTTEILTQKRVRMTRQRGAE
jgi:hypothetical protein